MSGRKLNLMPVPKIEVLQRSFEFESRKTLKLKLKEATLIESEKVILAIKDAREFLKDSTEYSRIEFRCGDFYYVVARLKEEAK